MNNKFIIVDNLDRVYKYEMIYLDGYSKK